MLHTQPPDGTESGIWNSDAKDLPETQLLLNSLFQDHAVFQRGASIPVWGKAAPNRRICCSLGGVSSVAVSNAEGRFFLRLPPLEAGGPFELKIRQLPDGPERILHDVWIGEVYLASGQSNMELPLNALREYAEMCTSGELDRASVHYFKVPKTAYPVQAEDAHGVWQAASAESAGGFSGMAFLFARGLAERTGCKVGIIEASLGGTGAECWISREGLMKNSVWSRRVEAFDCKKYDPAMYEHLPAGKLMPAPDEQIMQGIRTLFPAPLPNEGVKAGFAEPDYDDADWESMELPDSWTLAGYRHAGVFWFRRGVELPQECRGRELTLSLGAVDKGDITYFNGVEIGRTGDGIDLAPTFQPRVYRIPGELVHAGRNVIAVRAASQVSIVMDGGLIGPAEQMFLKTPEKQIPLTGSWKLRQEHDCGNAGSDFIPQCGPGEPHTMHTLFDNMIHPLIPYALRGVLWYQGECNAISGAEGYQELLENLIDDWRGHWGQRRLDFLIIQLPGYQRRRTVSIHSQWALLREAQYLAGCSRDAEVIVSYDTGDENDLHPRDKHPVALRAAERAAALISGREVPRSPVFSLVTFSGNVLRIRFETWGGRLVFHGEPSGFAICGADGVFYPAEVRIISDNELEVFHPGLPEPTAVYYAWSNFPTGNLYGDSGLPAVPFRWVRQPAFA